MTAAMDFRKSDGIIDLAERVSVVFAAVDPPMWHRYCEVYTLARSHFRLLRECDPAKTHCFVGHYLLINILTTPHWDLKKPPRGWVAMVVVGDYNGGELCLPELGVALPYRNGEIRRRISINSKQKVIRPCPNPFDLRLLYVRLSRAREWTP